MVLWEPGQMGMRSLFLPLSPELWQGWLTS